MSTFDWMSFNVVFKTTPINKIHEITNKVIVITKTDANETEPFRQKPMNPDLIVLFILVKSMLFDYNKYLPSLSSRTILPASIEITRLPILSTTPLL